MDQFEDYEEENSVLSQETENDIFFYPNNNNNNSILSGSSRNNEFHNSKTVIPNLNALRSPSPLQKNPFEDHFLENSNKSNEFVVCNRKALLKKENDSISNEFQKPEKLTNLSSNSNFQDQERKKSNFSNESLHVS